MKLVRSLLSVGCLAAFMIGPATAALTTISDFSSLSHWGTGGGPGADVAASSIIQTTDRPTGSATGQSGLMTYTYGNGSGFNYIDFYNDRLSLDLRGMQLDFWVKGLALPPNTVAVQVYSAVNGGFAQYDFTADDLDGGWTHLQLDLDEIADYGTAPDFSRVNLIRFRAIGDAAGNGQTGTITVHHLAYGPATAPLPAPEPGALALALVALGAAGAASRRQRANRTSPI
jgi:hypothetical protein